jgi:hypothetical protein
VNASDNTGLGLFDDTASAVGNFPTALRGYDRTAVDDYVRTLEESVLPHKMADEHQFRRSLKEIQRYREQTPGALIIPGHDWDAFSALDPVYE